MPAFSSHGLAIGKQIQVQPDWSVAKLEEYRPVQDRYSNSPFSISTNASSWQGRIPKDINDVNRNHSVYITPMQRFLCLQKAKSASIYQAIS
jgi:hypothetical protein